MEVRWTPVFGRCYEALTRLPARATPGRTTKQKRMELLALFGENGHPLNQMIIKLYDAYCASCEFCLLVSRNRD